MKQHLSITLIALKNSFAYKFKLFFYALTGVVQFFIYYSLWGTLFIDTDQYHNFNKENILTYFIISFVIQSLIPRWITMEIGWGVKRGEIVNIFLRPISFRNYYIFYSFGDVIFTFFFYGCADNYSRHLHFNNNCL